MPGKLVALHEATHAAKPLKVDREKRIIYGVKVIGLESKHGYSYPPETLKEAAPMYDGANVNIDHLLEEGALRPADQRFGQLFNPRFEGDGIYADLHYLKSHPMAERICEAAENMPSAFALSHHAFGQPVKRDGKTIIPKIERVVSVDVVADGATNRSLKESAPPMPTKVKIRPILEAAFPKRKNLLLEMEDVVPSGAEMDAPAADASTDDQAIDALVTMVRAAVAEKDFKKAQDVLKAFQKLMGEAPAATAEGDGEGEEEKVPDEKKESAKATQSAEMLKIKAENEALRRKDKARELCEAASVKPSATLLNALMNLQEADQKALIEEYRGKSGAKPTPPVSSPRAPALKEGASAKQPANVEEFVGAITF